jgi:hypothetical protein
MENTRNTHVNALNDFWDNIPVGKENAVTYAELCELWQCTERVARRMLHELSRYDNGDDYILIRSGKCKGFYKTDDEDEIKAYKRECLNKGRSIFAPVKKINRVLNANVEQFTLTNNLRVIRESRGLKQGQVCNLIQQQTQSNVFDKPLLSKMENGVILPTPQYIALLAEIYGVEPYELIDISLHQLTI